MVRVSRLWHLLFIYGSGPIVTVSFISQPPERESFHKLLIDYYNTMIPMNPPEVAAQLNATTNAEEFWDEVHEYMRLMGD